MDPSEYALSLPGIPDRLRVLTKRLKENPQIQKDLDVIINDALVCAGTFNKSLKESSKQLNIQGELVRQANKPKDIKISNLQKTLTDTRTCFSSSRMKIIELQTKVHCQIETCRGQVKDHKAEQATKKERIDKANINIADLKVKIKSNEEDASNLQNVASGLDERAAELKRIAKEKEERGAIGGIISAVVGVVFAPFTGGASLVICAAAAGITIGVNFSDAADCEKNANNCRDSAKDKRRSASKLRDDVSKMETEKKDLQIRVINLKERIGVLEDAIKSLEDVTSFLRSSVGVSDEVVEAIQDMDTVLKESTLTGSSFSMLFKSKHQRLAEKQLQNLKESWERIHVAMEKNRMFAIKN